MFSQLLGTYDSEYAYNENINTFSDIACHIKQEDEHLKAARLSVHIYVVEYNSKRFFRFKLKWEKSKKGKEIV